MRVLPTPTSTVPLPEIVPVFVNPPVVAKVAPLAIRMRPDWTPPGGRTSLPASTFTVPVLLTMMPLAMLCVPAALWFSVPALFRVAVPV